MRAVTGTLRTIAWALLGVQLVVAGALFAVSLSGHKALMITGGSMEPVYTPGDIAVLDVATTAKVGDTITFRSLSNTIVTHQIISDHAVGGVAHFRTQGTANAYPDPDLVPVTNVIGVPRWHLPSAGLVVTFLQSPLGRLVTFGPALLVVLAHEAVILRCLWRPQVPVPATLTD